MEGIRGVGVTPSGLSESGVGTIGGGRLHEPRGRPSAAHCVRKRVQRNRRRAETWLRRAVKVVALVLGAIGVMLVVAAPANAHAALVSASPAPGASLPQAPGAVVLRFSEAIDLRTSTIAVTDASEIDATSGPTAAVSGDARSIQRPLGLLQPGRYTVRWTSVSSDDGHIETGSYSFAIGVAASTVRHADAGLFAGETTIAGRPARRACRSRALGRAPRGRRRGSARRDLEVRLN